MNCFAWTITAALLTHMTLAGQPTRACSPPTIAIVVERKLLPRDGAMDVPLNASVAITYRAYWLNEFGVSPNDFLDVVVRPVGGEPIAGKVEVAGSEATVAVRFIPAGRLSAQTSYEVLDRVKPINYDANDTTMFGDFEVIARFVTGAVDDKATPTAPIATYTTGCTECPNDGCCGPYRAATFGIQLEPPPPEVLLEVRVDQTVAWPFDRTVEGWIGGGLQAPDFRLDGTFELRFVDVAGNRSEATTLIIDASCPAVGAEPEATEREDAERDVVEETETSVVEPGEHSEPSVAEPLEQSEPDVAQPGDHTERSSPDIGEDGGCASNMPGPILGLALIIGRRSRHRR